MLLTELIKPEYKSSQEDKSNSEKLFYALLIFIFKTWKQFIHKSFYLFKLLQQIIFGFIRTNNFIQMLWVI